MKNNIIFSLAGFIILFTACSEPMDIDTDSSYRRLVVDGSITTDTGAHCVRLTLSADYFYNRPSLPVKNADVSISDGSTIFTLTESIDKPGYYYTQPDVFGIPGKTYTLTIGNIDIDGNLVAETYSAVSFLPSVPKPDSIHVIRVDKFFTDYEVRFYGQDPADEVNYYYFRTSRNGILLTDTLTESYPSDDEMYNGKRIVNMNVYNLQKDKTDENIQVGDTIVLDICGITKDYWRFLIDVQLESHGSDPFGGQPANVSTNLSDKNKAVGFFSAYSIERVNYIIKQEDLDNILE